MGQKAVQNPIPNVALREYPASAAESQVIINGRYAA